MHLFADVLDKQLVDVRGRNAGKVDGIVLELRDGAPPRVAYIEVGPITLLRRFSERLARWYARYDARFGAGRGTPYRIPWSRCRIDHDRPVVTLDFDAGTTPMLAVERWVRDRIAWIPGSGGRRSS